MAADLNAQADARYLESARLRSRAEKAEDAIGRVLALCSVSGEVTTAAVLAAIRGEA